MSTELDIHLTNTELPSTDIELSSEVDEESADVTYDDVPEVAENQILAEGVSDLKDHPQLEPLLETLHQLKNEFHQKVAEASKDSDLSGFVKVLFSIREKA